MIAPVVRSPYTDPAAEQILTVAATPRRALFLDRDGVINIDHGYVHRPEQTDWLPGIFELCRQAKNDGMLLIVAAAQPLGAPMVARKVGTTAVPSSCT